MAIGLFLHRTSGGPLLERCCITYGVIARGSGPKPHGCRVIVVLAVLAVYVLSVDLISICIGVAAKTSYMDLGGNAAEPAVAELFSDISIRERDILSRAREFGTLAFGTSPGPQRQEAEPEASSAEGSCRLNSTVC